MEGELIICIPGPWPDRNDFLHRLSSIEPKGRYLCTVGMLADAKDRDYVSMDFRAYEGNLSQAFYMASKGKMNAAIIQNLLEHKNCVYLRFSADVESQKARLIKYSTLIRSLGGYAVKVDPIGPVHEWDPWFSALPAQNVLYRYNLVVMLGRDVDYYYSCGMRYFGLPDVEISVNISSTEAAELINQFNFWQISERPHVEAGLTYSLTPESPFYLIEAYADYRYQADDPFCNPHGLWRLVKK